jgi:hypothetical protein
MTRAQTMLGLVVVLSIFAIFWFAVGCLVGAA